MKKKAAKKRFTTDAVEILHNMIGRDERTWDLIRQERMNLAVATEIYQARSLRGLSQKQLARLVGTTQSVIARLEDADYEGHSLSMLRRIAEALGCELKVQLIPLRGRAA